jgi:tellurite resistance protein TehA-like permease
MYYLPEPPLFLIFVGLMMGVTCGLAFEATLKDKVNLWRTQPPKTKQSQLYGISLLQIPFIGICVGICVFLAAGLEVFIYSRVFAYGLSLLMTLFIGGLIWSQLQKLILVLLQGGSKALDLDAYE